MVLKGGTKAKAPQPRNHLSLDLFMKPKAQSVQYESDEDADQQQQDQLQRPQQQRQQQMLDVVTLSSSPEKEAADFKVEPIVSSSLEILNKGSQQESTPIRNRLQAVAAHDHNDVEEPHIMWAISPQTIDLSNRPLSARKSKSFSSSQEIQHIEPFLEPTKVPTSSASKPDKLRDPETELLAKFGVRKNNTPRRLTRTESAAAILKTPTKSSSFSNGDGITKKSSTQKIKDKSVDTDVTLDQRVSAVKGKHTTSLQEPITPITKKQKQLVRHATSPALGKWHSEKMARLFNLANPKLSAHHEQVLSPPPAPDRPANKSKQEGKDTNSNVFARSATEPPASKPQIIDDIDMMDGLDDDSLFAADFDGFDISESPSLKKGFSTAKTLLPVTPMSMKIKQGTARTMNAEHLFSPVKEDGNNAMQNSSSSRPVNANSAQSTQHNKSESQNIHSSDLEDFFDDDVFSDLVDSDLPQSSSALPAEPQQAKSPLKPRMAVRTESTLMLENATSQVTSTRQQQPPLAQQDLDLDDIFGSDEEDIFASAEISLQNKINSLATEDAPSARSNKRLVSQTTLVDQQAVPPRKHSDFHDFKTKRVQRTRTSTQEVAPLQSIIKDPRVHRYLVTEVTPQQYLQKGFSGRENLLDEVVLTVTNYKDQVMFIKLRDSWVDSAPLTDSIIHVIGEYQDADDTEVVVDSDQNLLVVQPDVLITCTAVSESYFCKRKIVLRDRLRSASDTNIYMVYGTVIHEIFQFCLAANDFTQGFIDAKVDILVQEFLEDFYLCKVDAKTATEYLRSKAPKICEWGNKFICAKPKPGSFVDEHRSRSQRLMSVSNIVDVEEEIWSPTYGLKGKIDVTVETCLQDAVREWKFLSPLEIKTSKNTKSIGHRAQTTLYTLLLSDRYELDIKYGVLVYSETGDTIRIPGIASEVRDLMIARNQLALGVADRKNLPPMIEDDYKCRMCERMDACLTFHCVDTNASITSKEVEAMESPGILVDYIGQVGHITPTHVAFFKHWNNLLTIEESNSKQYLKELWTMTGSAREAAGRCFAEVKIKGPPEEVHLSEVNSTYTYVLERKNPLETGPFKVHETNILLQDPIIISDESGHVFLASGIIIGMTRTEITVRINKRLTDSLQKQDGFDKSSNQSYHSMMQLNWEAANTQASSNSSISFRVDKDEFAQSLSVARNNLVELLLQKHAHNQLELIVNLKAPRFTSNVDIPPGWKNAMARFNKDQVAAIRKVLNAQDYTLILGMPGTGKTTTIAALIEILVAQQKTVLLASYTHSAVDTILRKVKDCNFGILRLGRPHAVHPEVRHFCIGQGTKPTSVDDLEKLYMSPPVVASTCLGITHWLFTRRKFDYCIVDEASQATLPTCLGPIRYADKFVLVGDHFQLSPLVNNPDAQEGGLDESLFKRLNDEHPASVANLEHQYRMCKDIMTVSNRLIYDGLLKCGSEEIANQSLKITDKNKITGWKSDQINASNDWLEWVLKER